MTLRGGCLRDLSILLGGIAVYGAATVLVVRRAGASCGVVGLLIVAGVLVLSGLFLRWGGTVSRGDLAAVEALIRGERPRPGRLAAVAGVVHAEGPLLEAPLTGAPCVAYEYTVHLRTRSTAGRTRRHLCHEGVHLTPAVIETTAGPVALAAMPSLEEFIREGPDLGRAAALAGRLGDGAATGLPGYLLARYRSRAGSHRSLALDWRLHEPTSWDAGIELEERALPAGVEVCAVGVWDEAGPALRSPYRWRGARLSVEPGAPEEVAARLRSGSAQLAKLSRWCLAAAALLLVAAVGAALVA